MNKLLKSMVLLSIGAVAGAGASIMINYQNVFKEKDIQLTQQQARAVRNRTIIDVFSQWLQIRQEGKCLADYFEANGFYTIAIYGMHFLGEALLRELKSTDIEVKYAIDKNAQNISCDVPCINLKDTLGKVDVIVVTPVSAFFEIEDELSRKVDFPIISIEDVIFDMQ